MSMKFYENVIDVDLCVDSSNICSEMNTYIISLLKKEYESKAFEKIGIIDKILSIHKLSNVQISNMNGNIDITFNILVLSYLPKIYDRIKIPIKKILPCGIFLEQPNIKVLISDYDKSKNYNLGDNIEIVLTDIRFEKDSFHCLASIH